MVASNDSLDFDFPDDTDNDSVVLPDKKKKNNDNAVIFSSLSSPSSSLDASSTTSTRRRRFHIRRRGGGGDSTRTGSSQSVSSFSSSSNAASTTITMGSRSSTRTSSTNTRTVRKDADADNKRSRQQRQRQKLALLQQTMPSIPEDSTKNTFSPAAPSTNNDSDDNDDDDETTPVRSTVRRADDDDDTTMTSSSSTTTTEKQQPSPSKRRRRILDASNRTSSTTIDASHPRVVRSPPRWSAASTRGGPSQLWQDECAYCCASLLGSGTNDSVTSWFLRLVRVVQQQCSSSSSTAAAAATTTTQQPFDDETTQALFQVLSYPVEYWSSSSSATTTTTTLLATHATLLSLVWWHVLRMTHTTCRPRHRGGCTWFSTAASAALPGLWSLVVLLPPAEEPSRADSSPSVLEEASVPLESSQSTIESVDPTVAGRDRRRRNTGTQQDDDDGLSFASSPRRSKALSTSTRHHQPVDTASTVERWCHTVVTSTEFLQGTTRSSRTTTHTCRPNDDEAAAQRIVRQVVPLRVLLRLLKGDDQHDRDEDNETFSSMVDPPARFSASHGADNDDDDDGPGSPPSTTVTSAAPPSVAVDDWIPFLGQALGDSIATAMTVVKDSSPSCVPCLYGLQQRILALASLVEVVTLVQPKEGREALCREGFTTEAQGYLVVGIVSLLRLLVLAPGTESKQSHTLLLGDDWGEITVALLEVLANLTHDNDIAKAEITMRLPGSEEDDDSTVDNPKSATSLEDGTSSCSNGLQILLRVLYASRLRRDSSQLDKSQAKLVFDAIVFTLSSLTNCYSHNVAISVFTSVQFAAGGGGQQIGCCRWLVRWILDLTASFQAAIVESSFSDSPSKHRNRRLTSQEEDNLVIAGNGFVLLGRLIVKDAEHRSVSCRQTLYHIILHELPGEDNAAKFTVFRNTLMAFMSLYLHRVGQMSAVVIVAVRNLIRQLEELHRRNGAVLDN